MQHTQLGYFECLQLIHMITRNKDTLCLTETVDFCSNKPNMLHKISVTVISCILDNRKRSVVILYWGENTASALTVLNTIAADYKSVFCFLSLNAVKVSRFRCGNKFKYALIHPPMLSPCFPVCLCGSLTSYVKLPRRLSCETKKLKPVKYPGEECLTINPFIPSWI